MTPAIFFALILQYRYPILIPAALLAGYFACMASGVAIRLGYLEFWLAYGFLMLGELIGDVIWYWVGYRWGETFVRTFGPYVGLTRGSVSAARNLFHEYHRHILFVSKLTTGFGLAIPILFTAGLTKIPFRRFMAINAAGQFIWSGALIGVGYFFGDFYLKVNDVFGKIALICGLFIALLCVYGFIRYIRSTVQHRFGKSA